uniref:Uncharacterized protein n=1 Tax=Lotharella globosa TaxID=91324 RepID=A0A6V3SAJ6_9EUKA
MPDPKGNAGGQVSTYYYDPVDWTPMQKLNWYKENRIPEWGEFFAACFVLVILFYLLWRHVLAPLIELRRMRLKPGEDGENNAEVTASQDDATTTQRAKQE